MLWPFLVCLQKCLVHVRANGPLGQLLLVRLRLEVLNGFPNLDWHCSRVEVCRRPAGQEEAEAQVFHCDRWLQAADGEVDLRSGNREKPFFTSSWFKFFGGGIEFSLKRLRDRGAVVDCVLTAGSNKAESEFLSYPRGLQRLMLKEPFRSISHWLHPVRSHNVFLHPYIKKRNTNTIFCYYNKRAIDFFFFLAKIKLRKPHFSRNMT